MTLIVVVSGVLAITGLTACSSSSSSSTAILGSKNQQDCNAVSAVLSDGPDPDADSVGYAEAQVIPLGQLTISNPALHQAVQRLASAYQTFSTSSGSAATAAAVTVSSAETAVNKICPNAAP
jgi:hypothetical protein